MVCSNNKLDDCKHLDFHKMPVIEKYDDIKVVRCTNFKQEKPHR